ncbi:MAG: DNA gyrase inhibitor YacG [Acidobacteriia bacterium]|nr:DNA gyrase inhibitor YacG [Terriglobia bacterium]
MKLKCPICKQPVDSETNVEFPFCSDRCRERDLGNWAMEKYKVAVPMMDESEPEETETDERTQPEPPDTDDE